MISANEQLKYRISHGGEVATGIVDYKAIAYVFCVSLIKDRLAAEQMINDVFNEIRDEYLIQSGQNFEAHLFIQLRNRCLAYLKTASKAQLLRPPSSGYNPERTPAEPEYSNEEKLKRSIRKLF